MGTRLKSLLSGLSNGDEIPDITPVSSDVMDGQVLEPSPEPIARDVADLELPIESTPNSEPTPNLAPEDLDPAMTPDPAHEHGPTPNLLSSVSAEELVRWPQPRVLSGTEILPPEVAPEKNSVESCVVEIGNLVRPFTAKSLIELLQRTGTVVDGGFWLDPRKSRAIVKVTELLVSC